MLIQHDNHTFISHDMFFSMHLLHMIQHLRKFQMDSLIVIDLITLKSTCSRHWLKCHLGLRSKIIYCSWHLAIWLNKICQ